MTHFCVAFKNIGTNGQWIRVSAWKPEIGRAVQEAKVRASEPTMSHTAFGVFSDKQLTSDDPHPRYLYNRNVLIELEGGRITAALGGLINSREADWF